MDQGGSGDGLSLWSTRAIAGGVVELRDSDGTRLTLLGSSEGRKLAEAHNHDVMRARELLAECEARGGERTTIGDVEALLVRVLVAAIKELARGLLPRPLRHRAHAVHKSVHEH